MELQAYIKREEYLLAELAAARNQVDKLLDQQQLLLNMIARMSGLSGPLEPAGATRPGVTGRSAAPLAAPAAAQTAAAPTTAPAGSRAGSTSASTSTAAAGMPAVPCSLADLFRSAAANAPHPAGAAAAASIAAAIAAVDTGDILTTTNVLPPSLPPPSAAPTATPTSTPLPQPSLLFETLGGFTVVSGATSPSAPPSPAAAAAPSASLSDIPVEVAKAAPTDPPPELIEGDDDIFWLSKLHAALDDKGFFPGDDDLENWFFGESTAAAVLAFQASVQLPETGVVDRPTWTALLGVEMAEELYGRVPQAAAAPSGSDVTSAAVAPNSSSGAEVTAGADGPGAAPLNKWPVLMEGDGGREVHALQVALSNSGFHCGEDDMRWWQFGDSTLTALKFFQSCSGLPESGVCDERTWRALLGEGAQPAALYELRLAANSDDEDGGFDEDMDQASKGRVWLLGEQRWEKRA